MLCCLFSCSACCNYLFCYLPDLLRPGPLLLLAFVLGVERVVFHEVRQQVRVDARVLTYAQPFPKDVTHGCAVRCCQIIACYRAISHPSVRRGERASAEVRQDFIQTLSDVTKPGSHRSSGATVSFPAFLDFYCSLTAFTSDVDFRYYI